MSASTESEPAVLRVAVAVEAVPDGRRIASALAISRCEVTTLAAATGWSGHVVVVWSRRPPGVRIEIVRRLRRLHPLPRLVAVLPERRGSADVRKALGAGADGVVHEEQLEDALPATVEAVFHDQVAVPQAARRHMARQPLSHRERQILAMVVEGLTNRQIGDRLFLAESTVKSHLSTAFVKIDARSRAEAVALILDPEEGLTEAVLDTRRHAA